MAWYLHQAPSPKLTFIGHSSLDTWAIIVYSQSGLPRILYLTTLIVTFAICVGEPMWLTPIVWVILNISLHLISYTNSAELRCVTCYLITACWNITDYIGFQSEVIVKHHVGLHYRLRVFYGIHSWCVVNNKAVLAKNMYKFFLKQHVIIAWKAPNLIDPKINFFWRIIPVNSTF